MTSLWHLTNFPCRCPFCPSNWVAVSPLWSCSKFSRPLWLCLYKYFREKERFGDFWGWTSAPSMLSVFEHACLYHCLGLEWISFENASFLKQEVLMGSDDLKGTIQSTMLIRFDKNCVVLTVRSSWFCRGKLHDRFLSSLSIIYTSRDLDPSFSEHFTNTFRDITAGCNTWWSSGG